MKKKSLSLSDNIFVGSMLFGLFFGAGNLIFPAFLGQEAGANIVPAIIGFIITAAGLPFLGVIAFGTSEKNDLFDFASMVHPKYAFVLTILLYMTIGPMFALPRTGTVAFEVSFGPYLSETQVPTALFIFTFLFFITALFFALRASKILVWVGKILNPIFLIFLGILILMSIFKPMGAIPTEVTSQKYISNAFFTGLTDGYQTMDALAALAFGTIVIQTLKRMNITKPKDIAINILKSGFISMLTMFIIYSSLAYMGATKSSLLPLVVNGGLVLSQVSKHYFGSFGSIFLAITVTVACLKTAIGLITACSDTFSKVVTDKIPYSVYAIVFTVFTWFVSNIGLKQIIELSTPILMFLYPLSITLIVLGLATPLIKNIHGIYIGSTAGALLVGILDFLNNTPAFIKETSFVQNIMSIAEKNIPLFKVGLGWILPMIIGGLIGFMIDKYVISKKMA